MATDLGESVAISNTIGRGVDSATEGKLPSKVRAGGIASGVVSGALDIYQKITTSKEE